MSIFASIITQAQLKVNSEGKVGITTGNPNAALDLGTAKYVEGNPAFLFYNDNSSSAFAGTKCGFYINNFGSNNINLVFPEASATPGLFTISAKNTSGTTLNRYFSISGITGNVGIGSITPNYKLDVSSWAVRFASSCQIHFFTNNFDPRICSSTNRVVFFKSDNSIYIDIEVKSIIQSSDSTKKKNIKKLESSLQKVIKINGYNYNWKDDTINTVKQIGLLAQEVERIIPEVVYTADSSKGKLIAYTQIIPYLIEAIKEQHNTIEKLKKQCDENITIQTKIAELESQIASAQNCCDSKGNSKTKSFTESETATLNVEQTISVNGMQTTKAKLYQNAPNPFKESTTIKLEIPETIGKAMVCIYDLNGRQLKCLNVNGRGITSVHVSGNELTAGMYHYALIADDVLIDTKLMVLTE